MKLLQLGDVATYLRELPEPPEERTILQSLELLGKLGALDSADHLTPLGHQMAKMSKEPQIVKFMMMGVVFGCLEPMLSIAAVLTFQDPFVNLPNQNQNQCRMIIGRPKIEQMRKCENSRKNVLDTFIVGISFSSPSW